MSIYLRQCLARRARETHTLKRIKDQMDAHTRIRMVWRLTVNSLVNGHIEEALDLGGVKVHCDDVVYACSLEHVCH